MSAAVEEEPRVGGNSEGVLPQSEMDNELNWHRVVCGVALHMTPGPEILCTSTAIAPKDGCIEEFSAYAREQTVGRTGKMKDLAVKGHKRVRAIPRGSR